MRKKVVLVVDDEEMVEQMIESFLGRKGYQTVSFNNPQHALHFFQKHPDKIDLVISDLNMPGLNGEDLARELLEVDTKTPVILITGFPDQIIDGVPNIKKILMKPVMRSELVEAVDEVMESGVSG